MSGDWPPAGSLRRRRTGRGLVAAGLSFVLPGAGQLVVGDRRRGLVLLAATVALVAAGLWLGRQGPAAAVGLLVRPGGVAWVLAVNAAVLGLRLFATLDAFRAGAGCFVPPVARRRWLAGVTTGMLLAGLAGVVAVPHAVAGHYTVVTRDLLTGVFADAPPEDEAGPPDDPTPAPPTADTGPPPPTADTGPELPRRDPDGDGAGEDAPPGDDPPPEKEAEEPQEPEDDNPWLEHDRLSVAILGSDAGPGRAGDRIDALLVVSVALDEGHTAIFSVERHLRDFPLPEALEGPWEEQCRDVAPGWDLLNAVYRCGTDRLADEVAEQYPDAPDPPAAALADTLGRLLGLPVDHYAMVDMAGFVRLVDALGGVQVELGRAVEVELSPPSDDHGWRTFDLQPGQHDLDGETALALVRSRTGTDGVDRMRRQRCLLASLAAVTDVTTILSRFPEIAGTIEDHVTTSIPLDRVPDLVELLPRIDVSQLAAVGLGPPDHVRADGAPELDRMRDRVEEALAGRAAPGDEGTDDDHMVC